MINLGSVDNISNLGILIGVYWDTDIEHICLHSSLNVQVTDKTVDIFEREPVFLERHLKSIVDGNPGLKVCHLSSLLLMTIAWPEVHA